MSISSLFEIVWNMTKEMFNSTGCFILLNALCIGMGGAIVTLAVLLVRNTFKK